MLTPEDEQLAAEVFAAALGLEGAAREAVLRERCGGNAQVRREVEELLAAAAGDGPLDRPGPRPTMAGVGVVLDAPLPVGGKLGQYTVLEVLGSGGMGVVYRAAQHRPQRTVALKVIRQGYADPDLLRRFELEAEMLGRLHHPGVAQIFEAGLADAGLGPQPFFAMELVDGPSLTAYAQQERLSTRDRVGLVAKLCEAVEHAHRKGVIHRDLKPANVLVTEGGQPKVLDFGVARATDRRGATLATTAGQLVGTLPYMSPEQVVGDPDQIDTRTDVYALGVILYELLTGQLPHNLEGRSVPEAARIIRDEEPRALRVVSPALRGELDVITHKAMARDKVRRYPSAGALGEELGRYLAGEPIEARRDSAVYVLRKQARKHRVVVAAAAVVLVLLVASTILSSVQSGRNAALARDRAAALKDVRASLEEAERQRARADLELWVSQVERGRLTARMGSFAQAEARLWDQHLARPEQALGRWALWELYSDSPSLAARPLEWSPTEALAVSPDGRLIVVGGRVPENPEKGEEGVAPVVVWSGALERPLARLIEHRQDLTAAAFSADGSRLVTADYSGEVRVWAMPAGTVSARWSTETRGVRWASFDASGERVVTCGESADRRGTASVWDARSGARVCSFTGHATRTDAAVFLASGGVLSADWDGQVCLWDAATGVLRREARVDLNRIAGMMVASSGDAVLLTGSDLSGATMLGTLNVASLTLTGTTRLGAGSPGAISRTRAGEMVTGGKGVGVVGPDGRLGVMGVDSGENYEAVASPGAERAVSVSSVGGVRVWETRPHAAMFMVPGLRGDQGVAAFSPDGCLAFVGGKGGGVILELRGQGAPDGACTRTLAEVVTEARTVACAVFSVDGRAVYLGVNPSSESERSEVWRLNLGTGERDWTFEMPAGAVASLAQSADGRELAAAGGDGTVRLLDAAGGAPGEARKFPRGLSHVAFAPGTRTMAVVQNFQALAVWTPGSEPAQPPSPRWRQGSYTAAYSPDGTMVAWADWYGKLEVAPANGSAPARALQGHTRSVRSIVFSPDGGTIYSAGHDRTVRVWDAATGQNLATLAWADWVIAGMALSPDGTWMLVVGDDGHAGVIDLCYYRRHVAGQAAMFMRPGLIAERGAPGVERAKLDALRAEAAAELAKPWPRRNAAVPSGATAEDVLRWGRPSR